MVIIQQRKPGGGEMRREKSRKRGKVNYNLIVLFLGSWNLKKFFLSVCAGLLFLCQLSQVAVCRFLIAVASPVEHRLWSVGASAVAVCGLSSCGTRTQLPCSLWDLSSQTRDQTHIPWIGRPILNHWTTREFPFLGRFYLRMLKLWINSNSNNLNCLVLLLYKNCNYHFFQECTKMM